MPKKFSSKIRYYLLIILFIIIAGLLFEVSKFPFNKTNIAVKNALTPTAQPNPFLDAGSLNLPSSYMGYTFTKLSSKSATMGENSLFYSQKSFSLSGTEWIVKKNNVSSAEFTRFKQDFVSFAESQLSKLGWAKEEKYNGSILKTVQKQGVTQSEWGYMKTYNGKIQVIILSASTDKRTCPCNIEFNVFLSNVYSLNTLK